MYDYGMVLVSRRSLPDKSSNGVHGRGTSFFGAGLAFLEEPASFFASQSIAYGH
jgi:hypothetical protein